MTLAQDADRVGGMIAVYNLDDWWIDEFSYRERTTLIERNALDGTDRLTGDSYCFEGKVSTARFLDFLGRQVSDEEYVTLGYRIYSKGDQLYSETDPVLDRHYYLDGKASFFYRCRNLAPDNLRISFDTLRKQVTLSPKAAMAFRKKWGKDGLPAHTGFRRLAGLYEEDRQYEIAIQLCKTAKKQGWKGDWDKRIERCYLKLGDINKTPVKRRRIKRKGDDLNHLGPIVHDSKHTFGYGSSDKHITSTDADGVALAAIQGLNEKLEEKQVEIDRLEAELAKQNTELAKHDEQFASLEERLLAMEASMK